MWNKELALSILLSIASSFAFFFIVPGNLSAQITIGSIMFVFISMIFFYKKKEDLPFFANVKMFSFNLLLSLSVAIPLVSLTVWVSHYVGK